MSVARRARAEAAYPRLHLLIDGAWIAADARPSEPVIDPSTGKALGRFPVAGPADVERAIAAAGDSFEAWRLKPALERSHLLRAAAEGIRAQKELLANLIALELGKPLGEALREAELACEMFEWAAEEARRLYGRLIPSRSPTLRLSAVRVPVGPAGAVSGWNAPALTPARKLSSALAAGCTIVLKPSEATPATAQLLVRALHDAGIPRGVVNMVLGDPPASVGRMVDHPGLRMFSFTGGTDVGRRLAARAALTLKRTVFELGGHAPVLIFDDVCPEEVAPAAAAAKFRNAGQVCTSPTRFLVARPIFARFRDAFVRATEALRVDDPFADGTAMGPLQNARRLEAVTTLVADARAQGAAVIAGGSPIEGTGCWHQPTVFVDVPLDARVIAEEPFGPIALLAPFDTIDEAIAEANRLPFGLAAYAATQRLSIAERLSRDVHCGTLAINSWIASFPETPFGGMKDSGIGIEGGTEGIAAFLQTRCISVAA
ncbi:NAD-dependent succinate-semialdehyde dehydrogenase [uncultured Sphingomonas sp.]|uniref:NAD-dependent succinate-semialdehyde dehydrogenase n=1 Tax=uncultured Sphingomonas sp. TaxID=158754 RepID=UPI0035CC0E69